MSAWIADTLARIWQEVLEVEEIGVAGDFFELGGDSILALTVIEQAQNAGIDISVRDVFRHPVLGELASQVSSRAGAAARETPARTVTRELGGRTGHGA